MVMVNKEIDIVDIVISNENLFSGSDIMCIKYLSEYYSFFGNIYEKTKFYQAPEYALFRMDLFDRVTKDLSLNKKPSFSFQYTRFGNWLVFFRQYGTVAIHDTTSGVFQFTDGFIGIVIHHKENDPDCDSLLHGLEIIKSDLFKELYLQRIYND